LILTGSEIDRQVSLGKIEIEPYDANKINPNSYNFALGQELLTYEDNCLDVKTTPRVSTIKIGKNGHILRPGRLYLGNTIEKMGSGHFVPTFSARSSIARLGLFINLSASLGDIGYFGQWTLQLVAVQPVRVYAGMNIGQMMWWVPSGSIQLYDGKYQNSMGPCCSRIAEDFDTGSRDVSAK